VGQAALEVRGEDSCEAPVRSEDRTRELVLSWLLANDGGRSVQPGGLRGEVRGPSRWFARAPYLQVVRASGAQWRASGMRASGGPAAQPRHTCILLALTLSFDEAGAQGLCCRDREYTTPALLSTSNIPLAGQA